jgi:DNA-binding IclR family transcriptional regulator
MTIPETDKGGVQVISRVAAILRSLEDEPTGMSLGAIAKKSDLPRSTVQRMVDALSLEGLLEVRGRGAVCLGPAFMKFASHSHVDLTQVARPYLEELAVATGETAVLVSANAAELIVLHAVISNQALRVTPVGRMLFSMYATAAGKILLARLSDEDVLRLLGDSVESLTPHTPSLEELMTQLQEVRAEGFAYSRQEHTRGIDSIALSIRSPQGRYAVEVVGPSWRIEEASELIKASLLKCQADLANVMRNID